MVISGDGWPIQNKKGELVIRVSEKVIQRIVRANIKSIVDIKCG